jgi:hypothetical protein
LILTGLPHSEISGSTFATNYPELFAGDRVLLRHSAPRHPPCALCSLTYKPASSPVIDRLDAIDMNGDRYVSSFDETRSSLLSSSVVKVHHSFGRAHENGSCVCRNEGFRLDIFAMAAHRGDPALGLPMLRRCDGSRKGQRPRDDPNPRQWSRGDSNS